MWVAASKTGEAVFSQAPDLTFSFQGSMNVHLGTPLLVPQWQCISSFIFMPPFEKGGHIALHLSVGRYVGSP